MAVDMFLKLNAINGESTDAIHKQEIDILGWDWSISNAGKAHMGGGAGSGKANFGDIAITKYADLATTSLMLACANGKHITEAVITVRKAGETPLEYIIITMNEVFVSNVRSGGHQGEERLTETISLNFGKIKFEYKQQNEQGSGSGGTPFNWSISKNEAQ